jgi:signal transduction histidine kinase
MTPIVGYLRLLLDEELGQLAPAQHRAIGAMEDCAGRLRAIIDNLLDVTGLETGQMRFARKPYDFLGSVQAAVTALQDRAADAQLQIVCEFPDGDWSGMGDGERLQRAIRQLLDNAIKFTPSEGTVAVRTKRLPSGHYELCVADTGIGIPRGRQDRIFDAFYQVDGSVTREHGGTGVGLAIVRRTARGLGGDLTVRSPAAEKICGVALHGSAFRLTVARESPGELERRTAGG